MSGKAQKQSKSGNTSEEILEEGESPTTTDPTSNQDGPDSEDTPSTEEIEVVAAPGTLDFSHPLLKGKSREEIERLVTAQDSAIRSQNEELNRRFTNEPQDSAPPPATEEEDPYGDDFIAPRFKTLEGRLLKHLDSMVEPLIAKGAKDDARSMRDKLRSELPGFAALEPHIDQALRQSNINPEAAEESAVRMFYYYARGMAEDNGIDIRGNAVPTTTEEPTTPPGGPPVSIPQHRPSGAPLPKPSGGPTRRELTEDEKVLAKFYFPRSKDPEGEYLRMQDLPEDEVVEPGFSKEGW